MPPRTEATSCIWLPFTPKGRRDFREIKSYQKCCIVRPKKMFIPDGLGAERYGCAAAYPR